MLNLPSFIKKSSLTKIVFSLFILICLILAGELIYWRYLQGGLQKEEKGAAFYQELLDQYGNTAFQSESLIVSLAPSGYSEAVLVIKGKVMKIDKNILGISSGETTAHVRIENQTPVYLFNQTSIFEKKARSIKEIKIGDSVVVHVDEPPDSFDFNLDPFSAKVILKLSGGASE